MAIAHSVAGPVLVTYNSIDLGYTRDGAQVSIEPRQHDVFSDDWGGQDGAPADRQMLGFLATIRAELTKYESSEVHKLTSFQPGGVAGVHPTFGTLLRQDSKTATLILDGVNEDWTFATAVIKGSHEFNKGTKYSTWNTVFEAWANTTSGRTLLTIA